jgi:hypothetical protein
MRSDKHESGGQDLAAAEAARSLSSEGAEMPRY